MVLEISTFGTITLTVIITIVFVVFLFFVVLIYFMNKDSKEDAKLKKEEDEKGHQAITHVHAFEPGSFDSNKITDMDFDSLFNEFSPKKTIRDNLSILFTHMEFLKRENNIYNIDRYISEFMNKKGYPLDLHIKLYELTHNIKDELPSRRILKEYCIKLGREMDVEFNTRILLKRVENNINIF